MAKLFAVLQQGYIQPVEERGIGAPVLGIGDFDAAAGAGDGLAVTKGYGDPVIIAQGFDVHA